MPVTILAMVTSDSTDGGAVLTFAIPVGLFVVVSVLATLADVALRSRQAAYVARHRDTVPADFAEVFGSFAS